ADVRRRIGLESPGHRQHAHVFAVDLRERAKAFAGVVAVVGGPTVFCGIQDRRGIEPLPACAESRSGKRARAENTHERSLPHFNVSRKANRSWISLSVYLVSSSSCTAS